MLPCPRLRPSSSALLPERSAVKAFGRFELRALLAKTERSMVWLAADPALGELILCMPRVAPTARRRWRIG